MQRAAAEQLTRGRGELYSTRLILIPLSPNVVRADLKEPAARAMFAAPMAGVKEAQVGTEEPELVPDVLESLVEDPDAEDFDPTVKIDLVLAGRGRLSAALRAARVGFWGLSQQGVNVMQLGFAGAFAVKEAEIQSQKAANPDTLLQNPANLIPAIEIADLVEDVRLQAASDALLRAA